MDEFHPKQGWLEKEIERTKVFVNTTRLKDLMEFGRAYTANEEPVLDKDRPFQLWTQFQDESPGIFEGFETREVAEARGCEYSLKPIIYGSVTLRDNMGRILAEFEDGKITRKGVLIRNIQLINPITGKKYPFKPQAPSKEWILQAAKEEDEVQGGLTAENMPTRPSWDEYFLKIAKDVSLRSEDVFVKHGCVIVDRKTNHILGTGYNGLFRGADKTKIDVYDREKRRPYMIHAEENSIMNCTVNPLNLSQGAKAFITGRSCNSCLQRLINFGIREIVELDQMGSITESPEVEKERELILSMASIYIEIRKVDPTLIP